MSVLGHEVIGEGDRVVLICHGILGSRRNWRSFARALVAALPGWRAVLVDLRGHGDSSGLGPPYTVAQCAADLRDLAAEIGAVFSVVVGHSFGGKVVLSYASGLPEGLEQAWVLDASPDPVLDGTDQLEVSQVIAALRGVPPLQRRSELITWMTARGFSAGLARWMTTNLHRVGDGLQWRFDLDGVAALIADYFALDLWSVLETPTAGLEIHVVRAERSERWTPEIVARLEALSYGGGTFLHVLADADHWVHVDNPDGLLEMMVEQW